MKQKNIILTGFMGTGKTVTAEILARRTGLVLVDMDAAIEQRAGMSIPEIFAQSGEPGFRKLERALARELSNQGGLVISTGGGVVLDPDNLADFRRNGLVVCLHASPETIFSRVENDSTRPLLSGDKKNQILALLSQRQPIYAAIEHPIDAEALDPEQRADAILKLYELENS